MLIDSYRRHWIEGKVRGPLARKELEMGRGGGDRGRLTGFGWLAVDRRGGGLRICYARAMDLTLN